MEKNKIKIKKGIVSVNGVNIGDIVDGHDGVVVGFSKEDGEWMVHIRECGDEGWSLKLDEVEEDED